MPILCSRDGCNQNAALKRPKTGRALCKECFFEAFEKEIHYTIASGKLFKRGDKVAIGASGGKDSTVLAYIMKLLNDRHNYGLNLFLLSIDEGISGYRDDSLETVKQNRDDYQLPLKILSYKDLYGWTMDEIVKEIGKKNNCTFCGVFRRQALDRGAALLGANMIVTGHNADDVAETVLMNILRGDLARLTRCTNIITSGEGTISRCKPLIYAYEKEIVMYAYYKKLVYFSTECIYSPMAYRGHVRTFLKDVERVRPSCILDIIRAGEKITVKEEIKFPERRTCTKCGFIASQEICKACVLLEGLNRGIPGLGIGKSNKAKRLLGLQVGNEEKNKEDNARAKMKSDRAKARLEKKLAVRSKVEEEANKKKFRAHNSKTESICSGKGDCKRNCNSTSGSYTVDDDAQDDGIVTSEWDPTISDILGIGHDSEEEANDEFFNNSKQSNDNFNKLVLEMKKDKILDTDSHEDFNQESSTSRSNENASSFTGDNNLHNLSSVLKNLNIISSAESNTVKTLDDVRSEEVCIEEEKVGESPVIIKSNAKKVRPKIFLPEMISGATKKLDF